VHRVVQEGLTNVRKHAPGATAVVTVDAGSNGAMTVTVRNGPSESRPLDLPGSGAGLVGLAERLRLVGGTIYSGPTPGGGWELRAVIPRPVAEETL
jgi:signal transduction histidine kinase